MKQTKYEDNGISALLRRYTTRKHLQLLQKKLKLDICLPFLLPLKFGHTLAQLNLLDLNHNSH